jgi:transcriptional regulator with XRE-family HTH domain
MAIVESGTSARTLSDRRAGRLAWRADVQKMDRERILRGFSQQQLARLARVDPGTLSDLLGCRRRPNLGTLSALCQALGMNLGDVIEFDEPEATSN